ncbi:Synaptosomal-associated protein 23 [Quaeritorhiza haematococci]|nr:Synaptosomal-associated protein 23 [Quaeritorhiza haematococci]
MSRRPPPRGAAAIQPPEQSQPDELDLLIAETLKTQEASAASTGRALAVAQQAEQLAAQNLNKLNAQGEQLENISGTLDNVGTHVNSAKEKTKYLTKLNRNFLIPVIGKDPTAKSTSAGSTTTTSDATTDQPKKLWGPRGSSLPEGGFPGYPNNGFPVANTDAPPAGMVGDWASQDQQAQSSALEAKIDSDLTHISKAVNNIKIMALQTNEEIDRQNQLISKVDDQVETNKAGIDGINRKLGKILKK